MTPSPSDASADDEIVRHGVSICVFRGRDMLVVRRGKAPGIGRWAPVGGHIEAGETAEAAALREVGEETAVMCRLIGESSRRTIRGRDDEGRAIRVELIVFAAVWVAGEPVAGDDAAEARFVAPDDLAGLDLMDGVGPHVERARRLFEEGAR